MAAASAAAVLGIREFDCDHELVRGADDGARPDHQPLGFVQLLEDRRIGVFAASVLLFHLSSRPT